MKLLIHLLVGTSLIFVGISCGSNLVSNRSNDGDDKIDSVMNYNFAQIDLMINDLRNPYDKEIPAIIFLEKITGISPDYDGTYFGSVFNDLENDLVKWKNWYKLNRTRLKWDEKSKKIYKLEP